MIVRLSGVVVAAFIFAACARTDAPVTPVPSESATVVHPPPAPTPSASPSTNVVCTGRSYCECLEAPSCEVQAQGCLCPCDYKCKGHEACICECGGGKYLGCRARAK